MHAKSRPETLRMNTVTERRSRPGYGRFVRLPDTSAVAALERAKSAFGLEAFGVVAEIDFRDTLQKKLDKDIGPYWTIEICNPKLADRALAVDRAAGLLLPCKVAVWQEGKDAMIAALRPEIAVTVARSDALLAIAREAEQHIERALVRLEGMDVGAVAEDQV
jgi:uncharacterized protein (DUF302 family)